METKNVQLSWAVHLSLITGSCNNVLKKRSSALEKAYVSKGGSVEPSEDSKGTGTPFGREIFLGERDI